MDKRITRVEAGVTGVKQTFLIYLELLLVPVGEAQVEIGMELNVMGDQTDPFQIIFQAL